MRFTWDTNKAAINLKNTECPLKRHKPFSMMRKSCESSTQTTRKTKTALSFWDSVNVYACSLFATATGKTMRNSG